MKKIILSAVVTFSTLLSFSQSKTEGFKKSDFFLTGNFSISSASDGHAKATSFNIKPSMAYFITDNVAMGITAGVGSSKTKQSSTTINESSSFSGGAYARYYTTPSKKFSAMFNLGFNYVSINDKIAKIKTTGFDLGFSPGINYFLANNFAIEATYGVLGFNTQKSNIPGTEATKSISFDLNLNSISFGLVYKL